MRCWCWYLLYAVISYKQPVTYYDNMNVLLILIVNAVSWVYVYSIVALLWMFMAIWMYYVDVCCLICIYKCWHLYHTMSYCNIIHDHIYGSACCSYCVNTLRNIFLIYFRTLYKCLHYTCVFKYCYLYYIMSYYNISSIIISIVRHAVHIM